MEIRKALREDIPRIAQLERDTFSEPWAETDLVDALEAEHTVFLVAGDDEGVLAYGLLFCAADEGELAVLAVHPLHRRQGVGRRLLQMLMQTAAERGVTRIYLEVRRSNETAQRVYEACGFVVRGERKHFYRFPDEDALVMEKDLREDIC